MAEPENGGGRVSYTVKDLLAEMNAKLDRFLEKLELKAAASDLEKVESRVTSLEEEARLSRALANTREQTREKGLTRFQSYTVIFSSLASTIALALTLIPHRHL